MNRIYLVGAVFLCIAACASSGPEPVSTAAVAQSAASSPAISAASEPVPTASEPSTADGELHVVDVPDVTPVAQTVAPSDTPDPDELICKRTRTTGSHRMTRVCMTRAQIEQARAAHQAMVREMGRKPDGTNPERSLRQRPTRTN